jgi:dTDP-4-amino-4,6-dideoxygalactose transaminase
MLRRQLAVASPISATAVARAFAESIGSRRDIVRRSRSLVAETFHASGVALTDSGTSALVLALRLAVPAGGVVGFPGFACVDLAAAARFAGVGVRLYDIDPVTLSPDLDSVERLLERGVNAIVVAHLFGYPADVSAVRRLAEAHGIPVIEDAAQAAGASLHGKLLGSLGDLSVLSFGRGKGLCAGGGGAVLGFEARWAEAANAVRLPAPETGLSGLSKTAVQWALGRPSLYAAPSMLPWLHLGEMVYHAATEPRAMTRGSNALLASAFDLQRDELSTRRRNAAALDAVADKADQMVVTTPIDGAKPGYLRYAVRDTGSSRNESPSLGVLRPYPRAVADQPEMEPALAAGEPPTPGAQSLARSLFTLPTHRFVNRTDLARLQQWLLEGGGEGSAADRRRFATSRFPEMILVTEDDSAKRMDHGEVGGRGERKDR